MENNLLSISEELNETSISEEVNNNLYLKQRITKKLLGYDSNELFSHDLVMESIDNIIKENELDVDIARNSIKKDNLITFNEMSKKMREWI